MDTHSHSKKSRVESTCSEEPCKFCRQRNENIRDDSRQKSEPYSEQVEQKVDSDDGRFKLCEIECTLFTV